MGRGLRLAGHLGTVSAVMMPWVLLCASMVALCCHSTREYVSCRVWMRLP